MKQEEIKGRIRQTYSLREIKGALVDLSRGGHPDDFIPENAKITITKRGQIRLEWKE